MRSGAALSRPGARAAARAYAHVNALSELAVRYMLTGSVHRSGDKVRLSAELCDCESGTAIWTDRFSCAAAELFELQDELSARVASTIAPQVQESELRRVCAKHPESLDAYECVARAGSTCSTASRTIHGARRCRCSSARSRSIRAMPRPMRWPRPATASASTKAPRPIRRAITWKPSG